MSAAKKLKVRSSEKIRVLIADNDGQSNRRLVEFLSLNGFDTRSCNNGADAKKILLGWKPKVLLVDLLLPQSNAFELLRFCEQESALKQENISVMIMSGHNSQDNIREAYQRGARDYLARPINYRDLLSRVVFHCRDARTVEAPKGHSKSDSLKIADLVISQALQKLDFEDMLHSLTKMAALKVSGLRCSIIYGVTHEKGIVLASNDKKDIAGLHLDLKKYPEVQLVINTGKMVVIDNLEESRALSRIKKELKDIQFNALMVCPLYFHHKIIGAISVRMPSEKNRIADEDVHFLEFTAKVISLYLSTQNVDVFSRHGLLQVPST